MLSQPLRFRGGGVRGYHTTVDGRVLRLRKDVDGQGTAITQRISYKIRLFRYTLSLNTLGLGV